MTTDTTTFPVPNFTVPTPENVTSAISAETTSPPPDDLSAKLAELEKRRAGEASAYSRYRRETEVAQKQLQEQLSEAQTLQQRLKEAFGVTSEGTTTDPIAAVQAEVQALRQALEQEQRVRKVAEDRARKQQLVMSSDPSLLEFTDYIPTVADEEEQVKAIQDFAAKAAKLLESKRIVAPQPVPASPAAIESAGAQDVDSAYKSWMNAIVSSAPAAEVEKLRTVYYDAVAKSLPPQGKN